MTPTYDKTTGLATFNTTHLSYYLVGYTAAWTNPLTDVASTDWFYDAVKYVNQNSLMSGTTATAFEPNATMTRAMLVTVLYRMEGTPAITGTNSFTDVEDGQWYTDAVIWASANGIVGGYGGGIFGTNDAITREQLAAILYNYAKYKNYDVTKTTDLTAYTDITSVDSWAINAMQWAVSLGLITGTTDTTLDPIGSASRAQVATILMRFIESSDEMSAGGKVLFALTPESVELVRLQNGTTGEINNITDTDSIAEILDTLNGFRYASSKELEGDAGGWNFSVQVFTNGASQAERIYVMDCHAPAAACAATWFAG
jgi:hypothetical protein